MQTLWQDVQYGFRMLARNPGFTMVAVLTLGLGIGANTALFSVVNGVLLNPLPYPHPEQLITLHECKPNFATGSISFPNFRDWQKENRTFSSMAIHRWNDFSLTGVGEAERLRAQFISSDFFTLLGVNPVIGRTFVPGEDEIGAAPIVLISEGFWKRKFGSSADVLGKSLTLDGKGYTIVGVIPASFSLSNISGSDVYVPIGQWTNPLLNRRTAGLGFHGIGRLKPGVTIEQARADMGRVTRNLAAAFPDANKGIGAALIPLRELLVGHVRPYLLVLLASVGFVLLIACVNVSNLLLARSTGRAREFAIRVALGAGQRRLVRQLLTESLLLAVVGGGFGLLVAGWGTRAALGILPTALPRAEEIGLDARVLVFTIVISIAAGILFGLVPAFKSTSASLNERLKEGGRGASSARHRAQSAFVVVEMAMALVLLVGAGLMIRSLAALWDLNPGFDTHNVLQFSLSLPPSMMQASPEAIRSNLRALHQEFQSTSGVRAVSFSWASFPLGGDDEQLFWHEGQPKPTSPSDMHWALSYVVEPDYLKSMGIGLRRGRFFTAQDDEHSPPVVVVDDISVHQYFANVNPIGQRIMLDRSDAGTKAEIVGVVGHVKQWGLDSDDTQALRAQLYTPYMQLPDEAMVLSPSGTGVVVRFQGAASAVISALRRTSQGVNAEQVVFGFMTMEELVSDSLATRRFAMILLGVFAAVALLLACVGIYGVVSYLAGQRTHEIGIRVALGACRTDILRLVLRDGLKMALLGVAIGLGMALGMTRLMSGLLYGVEAYDPLTFAGMALVLTGVAVVAIYVPARRATIVDPMIALRYE